LGHIEDRRDQGRGWRARYRGPDHRERSKSFKRRIDAEKFLVSVESAKLRGEWVDPDQANTRFEVWAAECRRSWHGLSESTSAQRDSLMRTHVIPAWRAERLGRITQLQVQAWVNDLVGEGLSASTVRQIYACFERVMRAAVIGRMIPASPCQSIQLPRDERPEMHYLSPDQVSSLATAIGPESQTMIYFAAYTGLRWGEVVGLKVGRVHLLRGEVEVAEQLAEVAGRVYFKPPKTRQSRRTVGLPDFLVDRLGRHLDTRPDDNDALVFVGGDGAPLRRSNFSRRYWKPAVSLAGLPENLRFHDLRHTCVAFLISLGMQQYDVMRHLGHASIKTTLDRYGHWFPNSDGALRKGLDSLYRDSAAAPPRPEEMTELTSQRRKVP
jgi:integrase